MLNLNPILILFDGKSDDVNNDDDDDVNNDDGGNNDVDIGCKERVVLTSPEGVDENNGGRDDYGPTKTLHYLFDWNSLLPLSLQN